MSDTPAFVTCGTRIDAIGPVRAAETLVRAGRERHPLVVHLCNAYTLSLTVRDRELAELMDRGDLNLMDGMALVWVAQRQGIEADRRVYGPDLMLDVMRGGRDAELGHFLLGGTPEVLDVLPDALRAQVPGVRIVGATSPPFRDLTPDEEEDLVAAVAASGADVVWVGLGTPKQDVFVDAFARRFGVPTVAVGAAFDFHSGEKRQAPRWVREHGLEWLYRLLTEPRRLWRRYLIGIPVFLWGLTRGVDRVRA